MATCKHPSLGTRPVMQENEDSFWGIGAVKSSVVTPSQFSAVTALVLQSITTDNSYTAAE